MRLKGRDGSIGFIRICSCEEQGEPNLFRNFCWFSPFFVVALDESSFACHRKLGFSRWSSAPINESVAILSNRCCWCCIKAYLCEQIIDSTIEPSFAAKVHSCHTIAAIPERQCYRQQHDNSGSGSGSGNDDKMRCLSTNGRQRPVLWRNSNRAIQCHSGGNWWIPWTQVWSEGVPIGAKQKNIQTSRAKKNVAGWYLQEFVKLGIARGPCRMITNLPNTLCFVIWIWFLFMGWTSFNNNRDNHRATMPWSVLYWMWADIVTSTKDTSYPIGLSVTLS